MVGIHSFAGTSYGREPAPIIRLEADAPELVRA